MTARAAAERRAAGHADVVLVSAPRRRARRAMRAAAAGGPRSTSLGRTSLAPVPDRGRVDPGPHSDGRKTQVYVHGEDRGVSEGGVPSVFRDVYMNRFHEH